MDESVKTIVISGINFTQGGPLSVFQDCLKALDGHLTKTYKIYALVHSKELFPSLPNIEFIEFPKSTNSYAYRLYYEYVYFKKLSKVLNPYLWLSLHDMTPNVEASIRAVYCHNPSPFFKITKKELLLDPKFALFCWFYKWVYRINIEKNDFVIVQQEWLRKKFRAMYRVQNCIVAYPNIVMKTELIEPSQNQKHTFFYPTFPRVFKNIEIIAEAILLLEDTYKENLEVIVTVDGTENRYSQWIIQHYGAIPALKFIGLQSRDKVFSLYQLAGVLIFPSKLETWGLPISEFEMFQKPIFAADLEYAHETVGSYDKVHFFHPHDAAALANLIKQYIDGTLVYEPHENEKPKGIVSHTWQELFKILLGEKYD